MSLDLYNNDEKKPWLNVRVNDLTSNTLGVAAENLTIGDILSVTPTGYEWIPQFSSSSVQYSVDSRIFNTYTIQNSLTQQNILLNNIPVVTEGTTYTYNAGTLEILKYGKYIVFYNLITIAVSNQSSVPYFSFQENGAQIHNVSVFLPANNSQSISTNGMFIMSVNESLTLPVTLKLTAYMLQNSQNNVNISNESIMTVIRLT